MGANACGKSTLLRAFARLLKPTAGAVLLDGAEITALPTREVAKRLGFLPQSPVPPEGLTVEDLVQRGRFPHQQARAAHQRRGPRAGRVGAGRDRRSTTCATARSTGSRGGQRQRAWIAMALAQDTPILLLDEPTTYLDLAHQLEVLDLLVDLNEQGRTIGIVLHDLNHACRYAHHLVALRDGVVYAAGAPAEIVDEELVKRSSASTRA